jgi:hypothetical protein
VSRKIRSVIASGAEAAAKRSVIWSVVNVATMVRGIDGTLSFSSGSVRT